MSGESVVRAENGFHRSVLDQIPTPVMAVDTDLHILYMNPAGCNWLETDEGQLVGQKCADVLKTPHCGTDECRTCRAMTSGKVERGSTEITRGETTHPVDYTSTALRDDEGIVIGAVEYIVDVSENEEARRTIAEQTELIAKLQDAEETIREQHTAIMDLSTPVMELSDGVLLVPLIGVVDTVRSEQMTEKLLEAIVAQEAHVAVVDVTGVPVIDTGVAQHLLRSVSAAKMLGTEVILTGFSPEIAQTLVQLNVDFSMLRTQGSLRAGVREALQLTKSLR